MITISSTRSHLWLALLIGLLALGLRILYLYEIEGSPLFEVPVVDARTYVEDARFIAGGAWTGKAEPFWQPPLYTYGLALTFRVFGEDYYLPRLFQALLGAGICILLYSIGRLAFSPSIALGAGLAAAFYGPLIYFGGELLPTIPAIFLQLLFLLSLLRPPCQGPWRWVLPGVLLGLAALAVANVLLFLPFLIFWLFLINRSSQAANRRILQQSVLLILGCAGAIAPVTVRNYLIGHDFVLISHNAGINFYIGNNPDYDRTVNIRPGQEWLMLAEMPEREAGIERPAAKSRFFFAKSWDFISADPLGYTRLLLRKFYLFWHGNEILRNLDPYYARNDSLILRILLWKYGLAFPFGLVASLAVPGLVLFWRSPSGQTPHGRLLLLFLLAYLLSLVLFFITARYRLPLAPLLLLFAGYGIKSFRFSEHWKRAVFLFPCLLVLTNLGAGPMDMAGNVHQHFWLGYAYGKKGMQAHAVRQYRAVLEQRPDHADALVSLAALYSDQKQYSRAIELYHAFLEFYPEAVLVRFLQGNAYLGAQRYEDAVSVFEELATLRPQWADVWGRLGYAYLMAAQPSQATEAYRQTLKLIPDSSLVRYQLAHLYQIQGNVEAAIKQFGILLEEAPDNHEFHTRLADLLIKQEEAGQEDVRLEQTPATRVAEEHPRQAIQLNPDYVHSRRSLGLLLARQGRYIKAIEHFERIVELTPMDYEVHVGLGNLYKRMGNAEKAEQHFAQSARTEREQRLQSTAKAGLDEVIERLLK